MQLDSNLTIDEIFDIEKQLANFKQGLIAQQEPIDREKFTKKIEIYGWTSETFVWPSNGGDATSSGNGRTIPASYYDVAAGKGWTLHGHAPSEAMRMAREFDKANPESTPKQMDQFRIPDDKAKEIASILKRDVKSVSGDIIKYADLIGESSNQSSVQMAA